jgi:hypothetical protein
VVLLIVAVAVVAGIAIASRKSAKPAPPVRPALVRGAGEDNADLMRRLQRDKLLRSKK